MEFKAEVANYPRGLSNWCSCQRQQDRWHLRSRVRSGPVNGIAASVQEAMGDPRETDAPSRFEEAKEGRSGAGQLKSPRSEASGNAPKREGAVRLAGWGCVQDLAAMGIPHRRVPIQNSSGRSTVVAERSASVMMQNLVSRRS